MYTPTITQLASLDFNHEYDDYAEEIQTWHTKSPTDININLKDDWEVECYIDQNKDLAFYPDSIDDIKTLIRMLTPPNN